MNATSILNGAGNILLAVSALGCLTFVVLYHLLADWRATSLGRNVMAFMAITGVLLILGVVRTFADPPDHVLELFRAIVYTIVALIVWHRVWLLIRYQRHDDPDDTKREDVNV